MAAPRLAKHYKPNDDMAVLDQDMTPADITDALARLHS
jgi:hypothetical protein